MNFFLHQNKNFLKKFILIFFPICLISIPNKALADISKERFMTGYYFGTINIICKFYKEGYVPEEYAKSYYKRLYSAVDVMEKNNNFNKYFKSTIINRGNKDPNCRNLMP